ncbi:host cell division inhibitor Icd-like protein [Providencia rettgeri]|uniref:Host cell division inhibitor Icd-like protein n=2 Tax=Providencia rettgeri TaxID=587 RepID=A0AAP2NVH8_PRORE|nr:host cell division inhibitor Icd-like protein [Providencia rettgeri]MBX6956724.1 host cell division inhibitor Icd-like protein [Providencia rettgeri]MBX6960498.1 host cell division inhibitor Icd-like protein [Providencia rettgeri]MBX6980117.1 host cell division inhibitor Icd-like protein [Providencia rettgeri]MBX6988489.1 host cell division inhibitor Icd-like protein [Providencia rettgeri]MBX7010596.1 host cell division inhibitor Icd-like protein [Providencia rettgeri]
MAMYKSTQTHPKFLWRFFSCQQSKYFSVEATSEQEARSMLPDSPCLFSARIRQRDDLNSHALRLAIVVQGGGVIMDKSIALFNAEYKSQQASTLFEVIFDHVCKQEQVDQYLLDLIGVVCDLNEQINRCAVSALEVANA